MWLPLSPFLYLLLVKLCHSLRLETSLFFTLPPSSLYGLLFSFQKLFLQSRCQNNNNSLSFNIFNQHQTYFTHHLSRCHMINGNWTKWAIRTLHSLFFQIKKKLGGKGQVMFHLKQVVKRHDRLLGRLKFVMKRISTSICIIWIARSLLEWTYYQWTWM